jgi:hypothetical protein
MKKAGASIILFILIIIIIIIIIMIAIIVLIIILVVLVDVVLVRGGRPPNITPMGRSAPDMGQFDG